MVITTEVNEKVIQKKVFSEKEILEILKSIDPLKTPYVILELDGKGYIQAAGSSNRMVIEARIYSGEKFLHYVIGNRNFSKVWCIVECKVGPIRVLENEVLNIKDAIELFTTFIKTGEINQDYNKRNVTKLYK